MQRCHAKRSTAHIPKTSAVSRFTTMAKKFKELGINTSEVELYLLQKFRNLYLEGGSVALDNYPVVDRVSQVHGIRHFVQELIKLPKEKVPLIVKYLFDYWASEGKYSAEMDEHTKAALELLAKFEPKIVDRLKELLADGKRKVVRIQDVAVGPGDLTVEFIMRLMRALPGVQFEVAFNDLSEVSVKLADQALKKAVSQLSDLQRVTILPVTSHNIIDTGSDFHSPFKGNKDGSLPLADIEMLFQVLDVMRGWTAKRRAIMHCCNNTAIGGVVLVAGETQPRFTICEQTDILVEIFFRALFHPTTREDTETELYRTTDGLLKQIPGVTDSYPIGNDNGHRIAIIGSEKLDPKTRSFQRNGNGHAIHS